MARGAVREGDGRLARSERTRTAAARALLDLVREGVHSPTVDEVASRAGVTSRSLYGHFPSVTDLHRSAAELATAQVLELIRPVDVEAPIADRVDAVCRQRAVVHEQLAPLRRAAALLEHSSPALAEARQTALAASTDQVRRVFGAELATLRGVARRRRVAALDAAMSDATWSLWREHHDMSVGTARATMAEAVSALLADLSD